MKFLKKTFKLQLYFLKPTSVHYIIIWKPSISPAKIWLINIFHFGRYSCPYRSRFDHLFWVITAPAATIELLSITQLSITIAPIPINTLSCIVQPCTIALCPIETLYLLQLDVFISTMNHAPSCMFTLFPIEIKWTSPLITAKPNRTWSAKLTSPIIVAFSAT
jgi:hypothetical protein